MFSHRTGKYLYSEIPIFLEQSNLSWNDLSQNVKEDNTLNCCKAVLDRPGTFSACGGEYEIYYDANDLETRNCIYRYKADTALYLRIHNETSHLQRPQP